jgi:hypothetical protein
MSTCFCRASIVTFLILITLITKAQTDSGVTNSKEANEVKKDNVEARKETTKNVPAAAKPIIKVIDVYKLGDSSKDNKDRNKAGIGDIIVIKVQNLKYLLDKSNCLDTAGKVNSECHKQEIRLFIDGRMIKDIAPESGAPQEDKGELQFHLQRNASNDEAWADILGSPKLGHGFTRRAARISVGLENDYPIATDVNKFILNRVRLPWFITSLIGLCLYFIVLITMARKSELLRDRGIDVVAIGIANNPALNPYSLGRFQLAFWFSLVITSFLFVWLITGASDIITPSILALIGISAGTSISGAVIDNSKSQELLTQTLALQAEQKELIERIPTLESEINQNPANKSDLATELSIKKARLLQVPVDITKNVAILTPKASKGFLKDILSDTNGVSFHRLQMFVWTIVLGLLFLYSVWARLSMPEFSATLLALQGLTAGTYLGFKIPEK